MRKVFLEPLRVPINPISSKEKIMTRFSIKAAGVVGSLVCLAGQASFASLITIQNASFESATGY